MKKALLALSMFSMTTLASVLPPVSLEKEVENKIESFVGANAQSITYFKAQHDLVGIGLVTKDYRKNVFYTNHSGDFLLSGVLIDTESADNLTTIYSESLDVDLGDIPTKLTELSGLEQGDGDNEIYAVIDINCGYCHKMWNQMQTLLNDPNNNVKVKWITVGFMGRQSVEVSQQIHGMDDKDAAFQLLSKSMSRQAVATTPETRVLGKEQSDNINSFMRDNKFGGVPLVVSKVDGTWNLSPGIPSQKFFQALVDTPQAQSNESVSD